MPINEAGLHVALVWTVFALAAPFFAGFALNVGSDNILLRLRGAGTSGYSIPARGAFRYVSCPNHLGETTDGTEKGSRTIRRSGRR